MVKQLGAMSRAYAETVAVGKELMMPYGCTKRWFKPSVYLKDITSLNEGLITLNVPIVEDRMSAFTDLVQQGVSHQTVHELEETIVPLSALKVEDTQLVVRTFKQVGPLLQTIHKMTQKWAEKLPRHGPHYWHSGLGSTAIDWTREIEVIESTHREVVNSDNVGRQRQDFVDDEVVDDIVYAMTPTHLIIPEKLTEPHHASHVRSGQDTPASETYASDSSEPRASNYISNGTGNDISAYSTYPATQTKSRVALNFEPGRPKYAVNTMSKEPVVVSTDLVSALRSDMHPQGQPMQALGYPQDQSMQGYSHPTQGYSPTGASGEVESNNTYAGYSHNQGYTQGQQMQGNPQGQPIQRYTYPHPVTQQGLQQGRPASGEDMGDLDKLFSLPPNFNQLQDSPGS